MTETRPIRLVTKGFEPDSPDTQHDAALLAALFAPVWRRIVALAPNATTMASLAALAEFLAVADRLDLSDGRDGELPVADIDDAANDALREIANVESWLTSHVQHASIDEFDAVTIGVALWAMRHAITITVCEPIVNALARRTNGASSKQETAAVFALMQGMIQHLAPQLSGDLERSNPERPWRILHINFAIAAIRTGDITLMRYAFDRLNEALPDEREGFYDQALVLAGQPGFPVETHALIAAESRRLTQSH